LAFYDYVKLINNFQRSLVFCKRKALEWQKLFHFPAFFENVYSSRVFSIICSIRNLMKMLDCLVSYSCLFNFSIQKRYVNSEIPITSNNNHLERHFIKKTNRSMRTIYLWQLSPTFTYQLCTTSMGKLLQKFLTCF